jgi:hypothetical protein
MTLLVLVLINAPSTAARSSTSRAVAGALTRGAAPTVPLASSEARVACRTSCLTRGTRALDRSTPTPRSIQRLPTTTECCCGTATELPLQGVSLTPWPTPPQTEPLSTSTSVARRCSMLCWPSSSRRCTGLAALRMYSSLGALRVEWPRENTPTIARARAHTHAHAHARARTRTHAHTHACTHAHAHHLSPLAPRAIPGTYKRTRSAPLLPTHLCPSAGPRPSRGSFSTTRPRQEFQSPTTTTNT